MPLRTGQTPVTWLAIWLEVLLAGISIGGTVYEGVRAKLLSKRKGGSRD